MTKQKEILKTKIEEAVDEEDIVKKYLYCKEISEYIHGNFSMHKVLNENTYDLFKSINFDVLEKIANNHNNRNFINKCFKIEERYLMLWLDNVIAFLNDEFGNFLDNEKIRLFFN